MERKKKDIWYDADTNKSKPKKIFPEFKKVHVHSGPSKVLKQTKISDLLKCKAPPVPKVDLSQLIKTQSQGLSLSQSVNSDSAWENKYGSHSSPVPSSSSGPKRKSDEDIEGHKKRERPQTSPPVCKVEISPMKLNIHSPSNKEKNGWTLSPPASRPSTSKAKVVKNGSICDNDVSVVLFDSPEKVKECNNKKEKSLKTGEVSDFTFNLLKGFDNIKKEEPKEPNFKYKEPVVRKKAERAQLRGWDCDECRAYYEALESQMDPKEIEKLKNQCSRHRFKEKPVSNTPENFWCTQFLTTQELYKDGYIQMGTPFIPKGRYRRRNDSDSQIEYDEIQGNGEKITDLSTTHLPNNDHSTSEDDTDECSFSLLSGIIPTKKNPPIPIPIEAPKKLECRVDNASVTPANVPLISSSPIHLNLRPKLSPKVEKSEHVNDEKMPQPSSTPGPSTPAKTACKKLDFPVSPIILFDSPETSTSTKNSRLEQDNDPKKKKGNVNDFTFNLLKDFDKIRPEKPPSPNFRYKEPVVRKKAERAQLRGWDCHECKAYYEGLESQMDPKEIERLKDQCSKHRYKNKPISNTPENFWCTQFPTTQELYDDGYIEVATPFVPKGRYRRNSNSELVYVDD